MPLVPRPDSLPAKVSSASKKLVDSLPNGKENKPPPGIVKKQKQIGPRRRVSLSSNDDRGKESTAGATAIGRQGCDIVNAFTSRKTPFRVHRDDKKEARSRSRARDNHDRCKQLAPRFAEASRTPRKPLPDDESRANKNALPSKIPRRRLRSIVNGPNAPTSLRVVEAAVERSASGRRAIVDRTYRLERDVSSATVQGNGGLDERSIVDATGRRARPNDRRCGGESPAKKRVLDGRESPGQPASKAPPIPFHGDSICNAEYHAYLPIVERETEERAPRLSDTFLLGKRVNADQRKVVVVFMLRLGMHCRYPSYIVYRAVKLFDAAIDRLRVDTASIQLTALTALWIALKTLQNTHKIPTASTMVRLAKDLYAEREDLLMDCERRILRTLDFNVTFVDAFSLLSYHLINCKRCTDISDETFEFVYHAGCYAIDATLLDEKFCRTSARLVAVTAAELVLGLVVDTEEIRATDSFDQIRPRWLFWRGLLYAAAATVAAAAGSRLGHRFQDREIDRQRVAMLRCVLNSRRKNYGFEVVYKKYSRSRFGRIAERFVNRASMLSPLETFDP